MSDYVNKAKAWDGAQASFRKGLEKGRAEAADALEARDKTIAELVEVLKLVAQHGRIDDSEYRMNLVLGGISKAQSKDWAE